MAKYVINSNVSETACKNNAKNELFSVIEKALAEHFERVQMVRVGNSTQTNEIGVVVGDIQDKDGFEYDLCFTVNATCKPFKDKTTAKKTTKAFDFDEAAQAYDDYLTEKANKQAEAKARKAITTKSEKQRELDEKKKALEKIALENKVKRAVADAKKRYRIEVDGETVENDLTLAEAQEHKRNYDGTVKVFEIR